MSKQQNPVLAISITAIGAIAEYRFVTPAGVQAGAGVNTIGVSQYAVADTDVVAATIIGTAIIETGGAIDAGGLVESDASGRAIAKSTGVAVARALPDQSAAGAGEFIEVLLIAN